MGGPTDQAGIVALGAAEYNAFELPVRRNVAVLISRIRSEGCYDLFAVVGLAARRAAGYEIERRALRSADGHAVQVAVAGLDGMGDGREARTMRLRMATLLDNVLAVVGRLPPTERSEALYGAVLLAVREMPVAPVRRPEPAHA